MANGSMDSSLVTGRDVVRKGPGKFVVCPNSLETGFVEDGVSFADAEVIFVFWEGWNLVRKI